MGELGELASAEPGGRELPVRVYLERARRHVLAGAADWPGWCRYGRTEEGALAALAACASRYAAVASMADVLFPGATAAFVVTERLAAPAMAGGRPAAPIPSCDGEPADGPTAARMATLLTAAWAAFYRVSGHSDHRGIAEHVVRTDLQFARTLGVRAGRVSMRDPAGVVALREQITALIGAPSDGRPLVPGGWPARYAARRIAWHVLDHTWSLEEAGLRPCLHGRRAAASWPRLARLPQPRSAALPRPAGLSRLGGLPRPRPSAQAERQPSPRAPAAG